MANKFQGGGVVAGSTDVSIDVLVRNADGSEATGKVAGDFTASYLRQGGTATTFVVSNLAAVGSAHSDGGVKEYDETLMPGLYRLDVPDAAFAAGADFVTVALKADGCRVQPERFAIVGDQLADPPANGQLDWLTDLSPATESGTVHNDTAPTTTAVQIAPTTSTSISSHNDQYNGAWIKIRDGATGAVAVRKVADYVGATRVASWTTPLPFTPSASTSTWKFLGRTAPGTDDLALAVLTTYAHGLAHGGALEADARGRLWNYLQMAAMGGRMLYSGFSAGGTSSSITLDESFASDTDGVYDGCEVVAYDGSGYKASGVISSYDGGTHVGTLASGSLAGVTSSDWVEVYKKPDDNVLQVGDGGGLFLDPLGLDPVLIEGAIHARQALSAILAAAAGVLSGQGTGTITIQAGTGEDDAPIRMTITLSDAGDRTNVELNLPS